MTDVNFPAPLFEGDTVSATTEVLADARLEIARRRRAGRIPPPRLQAGRDAGRRMPPHRLHGPPAGAHKRRRSRADALAAVRPRRRRKEARQGAGERGRRADRRSRGFGRAFRQARRSRHRRRLLARGAPALAPRPRLFVRVNPLDGGLDRRRSRSGHARGAGRDRAAQEPRRRQRAAARRQTRGS